MGVRGRGAEAELLFFDSDSTLNVVSFCAFRGRQAGPRGLHLLQHAGGESLGHSQRRLEHHARLLRSHPHRE